MFTFFLSALIHEILSFLAKHPDFFEQQTQSVAGGHSQKRLEVLENFRVPVMFRRYLAEVSENIFLEDLRMALQMVNSSSRTELALKKSEFFKAVLEFFVHGFAAKLDEVGAAFYLLPTETRLKKAQELFESQSFVSMALRDMIVHNSYQEIAQAIQDLAQAVTGADFVVIQAPREVELELKKEIRKDLLEAHPLAFPIFQVNRQLIGGLRLFVNGKAKDHSWFTSIQKISSLSY